MHGLPHVLAVGLIVTQVSGCSLLDLFLGGGPDPLDPGEPFPFPSAEAPLTTCTATIDMNGETVLLDDLLTGSGASEFGYTVTWENDDGWYLQLEGFGDGLGLPAGGAYLTLHRISDNDHLVILDPSRCVTTVDTTGDAITGSATCRGLQWSDFFASYSGSIGGFPKPIEGMDPFDAEITFEAGA